MTTLSPSQMLAHTISMERALKDAKGKSVFVGLPKEKVGGAIYGDGMSIMQIGAIHEFGAGPIPQRSFLRVPFNTKRKEINIITAKQFELMVSKGIPAIVALGRIGLAAENLSRGAFTSLGYGTWQKSKKKGTTLIDTGTLRNSISSVVRNDS